MPDDAEAELSHPAARGDAETWGDPGRTGRTPAGPSLWSLGDAWLRRAAQVISASADALNTLNVFPVSDADTGSNLTLTLAGVSESVRRFDGESLNQVVQAAILSAHGNSGAILAEMVVSACRAIERDPVRVLRTPPGLMVAGLLRTVAAAATQAVAEPVTGTILTVADEAAAAAARAVPSHSQNALAVAKAAQTAARVALARTPDQLDVLGQAGVVDAGGQAFVLLLDVLVEVLGGDTAQPLTEVSAPFPSRSGAGTAADAYEVMYVLSGAQSADLNTLRNELSVLGTSVVVVGDEAAAQVHVHLTDPGAAIEAALGRGVLSRIRVTALRGPDRLAGSRDRSVVSVVAGPGLADAVRALGAVPVLAATSHVTFDELSGVVQQTCGDLVILPNDMESLELATHLAADVRQRGRRVAVIPTVAQVQGLAAAAVHEPTAEFDSAVVAMSNAAGHTRHGAITIAESPAMTMAGRCETGDVLGLVEGDFVEIGDSFVEVGWRVVQRLLAAGGELLTLVSGAGADPALLAELVRRVRSANATLDVEVIEGGQARYLVLVGLE